MRAIGNISKVSGYAVFAIAGIWGFIICITIISRAVGFWGLVAAFFLAPVTFTVAPFYAGLAWGNWSPLILNYGGAVVAIVLVWIGDKLNGYNIKNRTLSIIGIGTIILGIISSATDISGDSIAPNILLIISVILTIGFTIMATAHLWNEAKVTSILLVSAFVTLIILSVIQAISSPSYGNLLIIIVNITKVIVFVATIWAIIKLFKTK